MYKNKKFDAMLYEMERSKDFSKVTLNILDNYSRGLSSGNPFNFLVLDDLDIDDTNSKEYLDFLYLNGVRKFIWSDESLKRLLLLMQSEGYILRVLEDVNWVEEDIVKYGLYIEIIKF